MSATPTPRWADCDFDDHTAIPGTQCCLTCEPPDDWLDRAACRTEDTDDFFFGGAAYVKKARAICKECTVRPYCLERGWDEEYGIWAGFTEEQRAALRKSINLQTTTRQQRRIAIRTIAARPIN